MRIILNIVLTSYSGSGAVQPEHEARGLKCPFLIVNRL